VYLVKKNRCFVIAFVAFMPVLVPPIGTAQSPPASVGASSGPMRGICVYYSDTFQGHILASGERYDKEALTAAHRTLPFGTMVKVTHLGNKKSVVVRINDRGPYGGSKARIIDITSRAAREIGMIKQGRARVQIEIIDPAKK